VNFRIVFSTEAKEALENLQKFEPKKLKKVQKTLAYMQTNLRHQGLQTHKYDDYEGPNGEEIFESYVENKTPGAFRVFWYYGPNQGILTIDAITPHP
jgi:hypothetical protein